ALAAMAEVPENTLSCWGAGSNLGLDICMSVDLGATLPLPDEVLDDTDHAYDCQTGAHSELRTCQFGRDDASVHIALVGDSHATHLIPALVPQLDELNWHLDTFTGNDCTLDAANYSQGGCYEARPAINAALTSGDYDLVIATSFRKFPKGVETQKEIISQIRASGSAVAVIRDSPTPSEQSIACAQRITASEADGCSTSFDEA